ncbi:MAG: hypothetical protein J6J43_01095 [Oscillospiraceae bacterium]|nr:hypothetical protein [Oscillospiraceae bacterium]
MRIPNSVRIAGVEYEVKEVPGLNNGTSMAYGNINWDECVIKLSADAGMSHARKCEVLWHEILHGLLHRVGLQPENEEHLVDMLAKGIYQVLQDNDWRMFDIEHKMGPAVALTKINDGREAT